MLPRAMHIRPTICDFNNTTEEKKQALHCRRELQRRHNRERLSFGSVRASAKRWVRKQTAGQPTSSSSGGAYVGAVEVPQ